MQRQIKTMEVFSAGLASTIKRRGKMKKLIMMLVAVCAMSFSFGCVAEERGPIYGQALVSDGSVMACDIDGFCRAIHGQYYYDQTGALYYWDVQFGCWIGRNGYWRGRHWYRGYVPGYREMNHRGYFRGHGYSGGSFRTGHGGRGGRR